jgi:hypothetical protein
MIKKVISGGQTGADRAGLDAAMAAGIPTGEFCPKGRLAEDGTIPERYPLVELSGRGYAARIEKNVVEADGTLILNIGRLTGGTKLTEGVAKKQGKPSLVVQLDLAPGLAGVIAWIDKHGISVLNIAGPRESKFPGGIYQQATN